MSINPYEPPKLVERESPDSATALAACSYCRRLWSETGPLVEAPHVPLYICRRCAQVVVQTIDNHSAQRSPAARITLLTLGLIALAILAWSLPSLVALLRLLIQDA